MRNFLMAAAVVTGVGVCTGAFAADYNNYANPFSTKTTAYLNFGFGGSGRNSDILSSLHYGLRMDSANPYVAQANGQPLRPAFVQADFKLHDGISGAMLNGVRFASHVMSFDEDTGEETSYSLMDWGLLAVGAAALGFGIAEVVKTHDDADPKTTGSSGSGSTSPTQGVCGTLNGVPILGPIIGGVLQCSSLTDDSFGANSKADYERINWLDSGNGHMGDLYPVR